MKTLRHKRQTLSSASGGYGLIEALVYISVVVLILGAAYVSVYRCIDVSLVLRRGADDIAEGLRVGELWRADVRSAGGARLVANDAGVDVLELNGAQSKVAYRFGDGMFSRRVGDGAWVVLLKNVKNSGFHRDSRSVVTAWRWELELQPRSRGAVQSGRMPLLFTFMAVPGGKS